MYYSWQELPQTDWTNVFV